MGLHATRVRCFTGDVLSNRGEELDEEKTKIKVLYSCWSTRNLNGDDDCYAYMLYQSSEVCQGGELCDEPQTSTGFGSSVLVSSGQNSSDLESFGASPDINLFFL